MRVIVDFLLHDWLDIWTLCDRPRYAEHSRETFDSVIDTCERIAAEKFAPYRRTSDLEEPRIEGDSVVLPACAYDAARAYVRSGMLAAPQDYEWGGMQLPCIVEIAAKAFFSRAAPSLGGGGMLTSANASLLLAHGSEVQKTIFARNQFEGRWFGTMCLSEPQAGSSVSDIATRALPDGEDHAEDPLGPRYRLHGTKMWISNGEHDLAENIVHLVLAKIPGPDGKLVPGVRGISLFIVPKKMVAHDGSLTGERNDIALVGLNHKLGYRGIPNTLLNFGEGRHPVKGRSGAIGYRVGPAGAGLRCMFHMMNEARIRVGVSAVAIGYAGYDASLDYARTRRQGRQLGIGGKDPALPLVRIIEHADVRRMLLAQKSYVQGGLALELYCARLVDELRTGPPEEAEKAGLLLELLTPIAKSWPSEWCLEANNLAIQVHGGYGYTRDFTVEQLWRDNRLNMIHEGTHGIHGLDLLGRKVLIKDGLPMHLLEARLLETIERVQVGGDLGGFAAELLQAWQRLQAATRAAWLDDDPRLALANSTPYLQAFGHVVVAWVWLDVAISALRVQEPSDSPKRRDFLSGLIQAMRYFFNNELPKVKSWLGVVESRDRTCLDMKEEWF